MEEEVQTRYKVKTDARCQYKGRGRSSRCVFQKVRQEKSKAKGFGERACVVGLPREFSNGRRCSCFEGMDPAQDDRRNRHLLKLGKKVRKFGMEWRQLATLPRGFQDHERRYC